MVELINEIGHIQILLVLVTAAFAFKGLVDFSRWLFDWMKHKVAKEQRPHELEQRIQALEDMKEEIDTQFQELKDQINLLLESDRYSIKAWITNIHHESMRKQSIDDYTLECVESRYSCYKREEGNSFVANLVQDLEELPIKNDF